MRLLIIEDEAIEREALKLMVDNNCEEKFETRTAQNGFSALKIMEEWMPDIAMVDINMPGINGLDTIRAMKKKNPGIRFFILSSYNRFEYAQEALKLGVEDFILKPAKIQQLKEALFAITEKLTTEKQTDEDHSMLKSRMEEIRPVVESDCIYEMIGGKHTEDVKVSMKFLGYEVKSGFCFVVDSIERPRFLLHKIKEALKEVGIQCLGEQFHGMLLFFVISEKILKENRPKEVGNFIAMLLEEIGMGRIAIGAGQIQTEIKDFALSYQQALDALKYGKLRKEKVAVYQEDSGEKRISREQLLPQIDRLAEAIGKTDERAVQEELGRVYTEFIMKADSLSDARDQVYQFLLLLPERMKKRDASLGSMDTLNLSMEEMLSMGSRKELELYTALKVNQLMKQILRDKSTNSNQLIGQAIQYIELHYAENLMLDDLAAHLEVSPFYLSKLFKKMTGKNFTDLLAEKRVEKAKELLGGTMSIKEVTFAVGFNSQNYFTKIFKKYCGVTPKEFRKKH